MYEKLIIETDGNVRIITINRPERRNALTQRMWHDIIEFCGRIADDGQFRSVLRIGRTNRVAVHRRHGSGRLIEFGDGVFGEHAARGFAECDTLSPERGKALRDARNRLMCRLHHFVIIRVHWDISVNVAITCVHMQRNKHATF